MVRALHQETAVGCKVFESLNKSREATLLLHLSHLSTETEKCEAILLEIFWQGTSTRCYVHFSVYVCILFRLLLLLLLLREVCFTAKACNMLL